MSSTAICACPFCDRDDLTPQGATSHERWCDENPNPGMTHEQQQDLGIAESKEGADSEPSESNPDQSVDESEPSDRLPSVETASPDKTAAHNDGGDTDDTCPNCGGDDVMAADDAKDAYTDEVDRPNPKAVLAFEMCAHYCNDPECATLWGGDASAPVTMQEVVNA